MRYKIGEKIPVVQFLPTAFPGHPSKLYHDPCLPLNNPIQEIRLDVLTVVEHHKVASDQTPGREKIYDGYILKDPFGYSWHSQCPMAIYDHHHGPEKYRFRRAPSTGETYQSLFDDPKILVMEYRRLDHAALKIFRGVRYMMRKAIEEQNNDVQTQLYDLAECLTSLYGRLKSEFERSPLFEGKTFKIYHSLVTEPDDDGKDELCSALKFKIVDKE